MKHPGKDGAKNQQMFNLSTQEGQSKSSQSKILICSVIDWLK